MPCASLQCGHCKSENSTSIRSLPVAPRVAPSARACSICRRSANGVAPNGTTTSPATATFPSGVTKNTVGCPLALGALSDTKTTTLLTFGAAVAWIASTLQMRFESYPHSAFKNALTVSTVGEAAVKYFGFAGGNGSALGVCPISCNCSGAAGFCAGAAGAGAAGAPVPVCVPGCDPVCAPITAVTLRAAANPANIQYEIFKESILRRRCPRAALLFTPEPITPEHAPQWEIVCPFQTTFSSPSTPEPPAAAYTRSAPPAVRQTSPAQRQHPVPPQSAPPSNTAPHKPPGSDPAPHTAATNPHSSAQAATPPKEASRS